jgi:hypothetical protein
MLTLNTSNPQAAYLGNPSLFSSVEPPPIDYAETDLGYVGCQNKMLLKIPQGQITIDAKRCQVFLIQGTQATDISGFGSGLNRFFTNHLAFEILRYFPTVNTDNHFKNIGIHGVYDSVFERVIITKLDYVPQPGKEVFYDEVVKQFYVDQPVAGDLVVKKYIEVTDLEYFCNKSWTVSFNFNTKSWVSFHTYLPNFYIGENSFFYSGLNEGCDVTAVAVVPIPSPTTTTTTTIIIYCNLTGTAVVTGYPCLLEGTATEQTTTTTTTTTPPNCTLTAGSVQVSYLLYSEDRFHFSNSILGTCIAVASPAYYEPGALLFDPVVKIFQDPQGLVPFPYTYVTDTLFSPPTAIYNYNSTTGVVGSYVSSCL